jgi:hypothetical protein
MGIEAKFVEWGNVDGAKYAPTMMYGRNIIEEIAHAGKGVESCGD